MSGSDDTVASHPQLPKEHIEELERVARGDDGVTIDAVDFHFDTKFTVGSCRCHYSIWRNNYRRFAGHSGRSFDTYFTTKADDALQILQTCVASSTLECLSFRFELRNQHDLERLMGAVFPVVCTSRRLATLSFSVRRNGGCWLLAAESGALRRFLETGFPVLLRNNYVICRLTVAREGTTVEYESSRPLKLVGGPDRRLVCSISRNQVMRESQAGWTLASRTCDPDMIPQPERGTVQEMFALFPVDNALLKEVVLTRNWRGRGRNYSCVRFDDNAAGLVAHNVTTLEQLDAGGYFSSFRDSSLAPDAERVPHALRCNRSVKEFQYCCSKLAELHELVRVFVPSRGRESNSSLSTLKVRMISGSSRMADCIIALAPLQGATVTALKQVVVCTATRSSTVMLMSSDDSEPHPDAGCVTLSRLKVRFDSSTWTWDPEQLQYSLSAVKDVLKISTATAHMEIVPDYQLDDFLVLQRTGSCSGLQSSLRSSFSVLKLHLPPVHYRPGKGYEEGVAQCWMMVVEGLLSMVPTIERVEAVHKPWLAPCEFEKGMQGEVEKGLKRLLKKKLRGNTCLQSLQVGWWHLVRVGAGDDEWEMSYDGPCLRRRDEYHVEVQVQ